MQRTPENRIGIRFEESKVRVGHVANLVWDPAAAIALAGGAENANLTIVVTAFVPPGAAPGTEGPTAEVFRATVPASLGRSAWPVPWLLAHASESPQSVPIDAPPGVYEVVIVSQVSVSDGAERFEPASTCSASLEGWSAVVLSISAPAPALGGGGVERFAVEGVRAGAEIEVVVDQCALPATRRARLELYSAIDERSARDCALRPAASPDAAPCGTPTVSVVLAAREDPEAGTTGGNGGATAAAADDDDGQQRVVLYGTLPTDSANTDMSAVLVMSEVDDRVRSVAQRGVVWTTLTLTIGEPADGSHRDTLGPTRFEHIGDLNRYYLFSFARAPAAKGLLSASVLVGLESRLPGAHLCIYPYVPDAGFLVATRTCRDVQVTEVVDMGFVTISEAVSCCVDERLTWVGQRKYRSIRAGPVGVPGEGEAPKEIRAVVTPVSPSGAKTDTGNGGFLRSDGDSATPTARASDDVELVVGVVVTGDTLGQVLVANAVVWSIVAAIVLATKARHRISDFLAHTCGCFRCFRRPGLSSSSGNARPLLSQEAAAELDMIAMREIMDAPPRPSQRPRGGDRHRAAGGDEGDNEGERGDVGGSGGGGEADTPFLDRDGVDNNVNNHHRDDANNNVDNVNANVAVDDDDDDDDECRICREPTAEPLISPCRCSGSLRHVHRSCIDSWRTRGNGDPMACDVCRAPYDFPVPIGTRLRSYVSTRFLHLTHGQQLLVACAVMEAGIVLGGYLLKFYLAAFFCEHGLYSWSFWSFVHHFLGASVACGCALAGYIGFAITKPQRRRRGRARTRTHNNNNNNNDGTDFVNLDAVEAGHQNPGFVVEDHVDPIDDRRDTQPRPAVLLTITSALAIPLLSGVGIAVDGLVWVAFSRGSGNGWLPRDVTNYPVCVAFAAAAASIGFVLGSCVSGITHRPNQGNHNHNAANTHGNINVNTPEDGDGAAANPNNDNIGNGGAMLLTETGHARSGRTERAPRASSTGEPEDEDSYSRYL